MQESTAKVVLHSKTQQLLILIHKAFFKLLIVLRTRRHCFFGKLEKNKIKNLCFVFSPILRFIIIMDWNIKNFIFILPSVPRSAVKMSVNQLIKNKRPKFCKISLISFYDA